MAPRRRKMELPNWGIPVSYALIAVVAAFGLPRIESHWFPNMNSGMSPVAAVVIYSSIASGMMALTGVVFSLVFVMVQFSAIAYSPRLVHWIVRDRVLWHSLGVFTATFLYALGAIAPGSTSRRNRKSEMSCQLPGRRILRLISRVNTTKTVAGVKGCSWRAATNGRYRTANGLPRTLV